jgi:hypothetical protein
VQARNAMLTIRREKQGWPAAPAWMRPASGICLTSTTANSTTDNAFRLMVAMGIALEARLPTGERVQVVNSEAPAKTTEFTAAA